MAKQKWVVKDRPETSLNRKGSLLKYTKLKKSVKVKSKDKQRSHINVSSIEKQVNFLKRNKSHNCSSFKLGRGSLSENLRIKKVVDKTNHFKRTQRQEHSKNEDRKEGLKKSKGKMFKNVSCLADLTDLKTKLIMLKESIAKNAFNGRKDIAKNIYRLILKDFESKKKLNKKDKRKASLKRTTKITDTRRKVNTSVRNVSNSKKLKTLLSFNKIKSKKRIKLFKTVTMTLNRLNKNSTIDSANQTSETIDKGSFCSLIASFTNKEIRRNQDGNILMKDILLYLKQQGFSINALTNDLLPFIQLFVENNQKNIIFNRLRSLFTTKQINYNKQVSKALYNIASQSQLSIAYLSNFNLDNRMFDRIVSEIDTNGKFISSQKKSRITEQEMSLLDTENQSLNMKLKSTKKQFK